MANKTKCPVCNSPLHKTTDVDAPNDGVTLYCKKCDKWYLPEDNTDEIHLETDADYE